MLRRGGWRPPGCGRGRCTSPWREDEVAERMGIGNGVLSRDQYLKESQMGGGRVIKVELGQAGVSRRLYLIRPARNIWLALELVSMRTPVSSDSLAGLGRTA